ncbi:MAG: phosphate acyltransferase, partial [Actinomyces sp.]
MSRFIVVAPGSSEAAALATDELARVLGVATVDALAGTTATDAALRPASALPAAVEAVRAAGDDALIAPAREASNRAFDHVAWNLNLAASTRAGVVLAFDAEGASAELLSEEIAAARLRAEAAAASVVAVVLTGGAPALEADVPVLTLPLGDEAAATLRATATPTAVTPLAFQADLIERARADRKRIVLPEPDDDRVLQAAAQVLAAGIADITFVGDADYVAKRAGELGLDLSAAQVVSVNDPAYLERYAEEFARLRAKKGVTLEQAREKVTDVSYFGTMM